MLKNTALCCTTINPDSKILEKNIYGWKNKHIFISLDLKALGKKSVYKNFIAHNRKPVSPYERICPLNSYSRKNISFIEAFKNDCQFIFETDDDNQVNFKALVPDPTFYFLKKGKKYKEKENLFSKIYFCNDNIWARGYPLKWLEEKSNIKIKKSINSKKIGIVQFLVNGNPDVDAIFRLVKSNSINLRINKQSLPIEIFKTYHPFNSQATLWPRSNFCLMYLPSTCDFRMCDIWRGYIAQCILYKFDEGVLFDLPTVRQIRNEQLIYENFFSEYRGYKQSELLVNFLSDYNIKSKTKEQALVEIYRELVRKNFFQSSEIKQLLAYLKSLK